MACSFWLQAQELSMPVYHLGVGAGLPQGSIYSLYQDKKGFVWIGTGDGLARWDGHSFRTFRGRHDDTSGRSLAARMIRGPMVEDTAGGLWMTTSVGLAVYNQRTERFRLIQIASDYEVENASILGIDSRQEVYLNSQDQIYRVMPESGTVKTHGRLPHRLIGGVMWRDEIYCIDSIGLFRVTRGKGTLQQVLAMPGLSSLFATKNALHLWTAENMYALNADGSITTFAVPSGMRGPFTPKMPADEYMYYGVDRLGFLRLDLKRAKVERFATKTDPTHSLSSALIMTTMLDRSQNLWVGTEGAGLDIVDTKGSKFLAYPPIKVDGKAPGLMVKSLLDVGGKLWIGTFDDGLFVLDRQTGVAKHWKGDGKLLHRTSLLFRDSDGRIWMNQEGVIGIADTNTKQLLISRQMPEPSDGNLTAFAMLELSPGDYLLSSTFRLYRMRLSAGGIDIRPIAYGSNPTTGIIAAMTRWSDSSIFIGKVRDGFYRLRLRGDDIDVVDDGLHYTGIRDFHKSSDGRHLWMATENGLAYYSPGKRSMRLLDEADGLSNSHIYGIVPEGDSAVWVSTNKGLNRVQPEYRLHDTLMHVSVRSYTEQDGLQSNEFNTGAFCATSDGAIVFGGVAGVNWFYPRHFGTNPFPPQVALTSISVNEKPLQSDTACAYLQLLSLPYTSNTLAFEVAALEFTNPVANRYAYKLEGFDRDWVNGGSSGEARYANLPPGNYTFLAKARNGDGVWSIQPAMLNIIIHPPWWQTNIARIAMVVLVLALLALGIRIYIRRRVAAQLRALEKQQAVNEERLRISRDMHDELGTGLTKIALLSQVIQRKGLLSQRQPLTEIADTSRQLTQKIGEIVWTLNPQNDTLDTLASYIREWVQEQYDALEDVVVRSDFEEHFQPVGLGHSVRQALLLVTKEAVNNAVKYAGAAEIVIRIRLSQTEILFEVCDDGCGFLAGDRNRTGSGNGLKNMHARMELVGGSFRIESAKGKGTCVRFGVLRKRGAKE